MSLTWLETAHSSPLRHQNFVELSRSSQHVTMFDSTRQLCIRLGPTCLEFLPAFSRDKEKWYFMKSGFFLYYFSFLFFSFFSFFYKILYLFLFSIISHTFNTTTPKKNKTKKKKTGRWSEDETSYRFNTSFQSFPMTSWSVEQVCDFLLSLGMTKYISSFQTNEIDGATLVMLEEGDFLDCLKMVNVIGFLFFYFFIFFLLFFYCFFIFYFIFFFYYYSFIVFLFYFLFFYFFLFTFDPFSSLFPLSPLISLFSFSTLERKKLLGHIKVFRERLTPSRKKKIKSKRSLFFLSFSFLSFSFLFSPSPFHSFSNLNLTEEKEEKQKRGEEREERRGGEKETEEREEREERGGRKEREKRVFLSYCWENQKDVLKMRDLFLSFGISVWMDVDCLKTGDNVLLVWRERGREKRKERETEKKKEKKIIN